MLIFVLQNAQHKACAHQKISDTNKLAALSIANFATNKTTLKSQLLFLLLSALSALNISH